MWMIKVIVDGRKNITVVNKQRLNNRKIEKKITVFIYRYLFLRKKTLRRALACHRERENNESFHRENDTFDEKQDATK